MYEFVVPPSYLRIFLKNSLGVHRLSNTSNRYLRRFNEACVSLNSSEGISGTLTMKQINDAGAPVGVLLQMQGCQLWLLWC